MKDVLRKPDSDAPRNSDIAAVWFSSPAGTAAVSAVTTAGTAAVSAVTTAGTAAVSVVTTAGTAAVSVVTTAGTAAVSAVTTCTDTVTTAVTAAVALLLLRLLHVVSTDDFIIVLCAAMFADARTTSSRKIDPHVR